MRTGLPRPPRLKFGISLGTRVRGYSLTHSLTSYLSADRGRGVVDISDHISISHLTSHMRDGEARDKTRQDETRRDETRRDDMRCSRGAPGDELCIWRRPRYAYGVNHQSHLTASSYEDTHYSTHSCETIPPPFSSDFSLIHPRNHYPRRSLTRSKADTARRYTNFIPRPMSIPRPPEKA